MQRRAVLAVTAAGLTAAASLLVVTPASAAAPNAESPRIAGVAVRAMPAQSGAFRVTGAAKSVSGLDEAAMQDLATYAKESRRSLSTVVAAHRGIHEFSAYVTELEESHPDVFVRAGLGAAGGGNWIQFTSKPSDAVVAKLKSLPADTEVQYGAPASSKELADLAYKLTKSLKGRPDAVRAAGTRYDPKERVLRLQYAPAAGLRANALGSALQDALTASAVRGKLPVNVVLESHAGMTGVTEATVEGGRDLNLSSGAAHCTAGFTAVRNGNRGVLTARHCNNALRYGNTAGVISTDPAVTNNGAIDFQFHRTLTGNGHGTNKQFRATSRASSGDRTVTSVANAPIGSTVCHWGRTSGYRCSSVVDTDTCRTLSGHQYCGLDVTERDVSEGGDSGGPWFFGNAARGGHSGASSGAASYFTRIGRVSRHLDATVLQN